VHTFLYSVSGSVNLWNSTDVKLSSATNEALDNAAEAVDGVNAAKVAAMKAAELGMHFLIP
jgi:hypothetical protein